MIYNCTHLTTVVVKGPVNKLDCDARIVCRRAIRWSCHASSLSKKEAISGLSRCVSWRQNSTNACSCTVNTAISFSCWGSCSATNGNYPRWPCSANSISLRTDCGRSPRCLQCCRHTADYVTPGLKVTCSHIIWTVWNHPFLNRCFWDVIVVETIQLMSYFHEN